MPKTINFLQAAIAASCFAVAACGGSVGSSSAPSGDAPLAALKVTVAGDAAAAVDASPSGTRIPAATLIIDVDGNRWTVADGEIYENGALAGYSRAVTLLLYDRARIYQENSAGGWWWWNGGTWVSSSDPRKTASPEGSEIPSAVQITDAGGNVWAVSGGEIYENGALAGYSRAVTRLLFDKQSLYQENDAGGWWFWNGSTWVLSSDPRDTASPSGSEIPGVAQITDVDGNVWAVSGGLIFVNGALAGYSNKVIELAYDNGVVYQENSSAAWWMWSGGTWVATSPPGTAPVAGGGSATLSWTAPTENTNGSALMDLAGYRIYYGDSPGALTEMIQVADASATTYVVGNLSAGTYYFAIAAYASDGTQSAPSSSASKAVL